MTGTLTDREFHGWQDMAARATVAEDGTSVIETEFDAVDAEVSAEERHRHLTW